MYGGLIILLIPLNSPYLELSFLSEDEFPVPVGSAIEILMICVRIHFIKVSVRNSTDQYAYDCERPFFDLAVLANMKYTNM